jgi:hypothetical protein
MRELLGKLLGNSLNPNSVRAVPKSKTFDSRRLHHTFTFRVIQFRAAARISFAPINHSAGNSHRYQST